MNLKEKLYKFCQTYVNGRTKRIYNSIQNIQESLSSETKSSAGDKHETSRAMLQLEREKLGQQLAEAEKMNEVLSKVSLKNDSKIIGLGSFVKSTKANYYLAISAGEFKLEKLSIFCISAMTPIGQLLFSKSVGDVIFFAGEEIKILEVK